MAFWTPWVRSAMKCKAMFKHIYDDPPATGLQHSASALPPIGMAVLLMLMPVDVSAQVESTDGLFTPLEPALQSAAPSAESFPDHRDATEASRITTIRRRLVRVTTRLLTAARTRRPAARDSGDVNVAPLTLNLFDDVLLSAVVDRAASTATGTGYALSGRIVGGDGRDALGEMTLLVYGDAVTGTIHAPSGTFIIQPVGDGVHVVSQVDTSRLPPPAEPVPPSPGPDTLPLPAPAAPVPSSPVPEALESGASPAVNDAPTAAADATRGLTMIDVAVFYTPSARANAPRLSGIAGITGLVDLMFENANAAYETSGVMQRIRLVQMAETAYTESGSSFTDLDRLEGTSDEFMREVHRIRDRHSADLVHLISDPEDVCGIATTRGAFGLTDWSCEIGRYAFAHELGHNMSALHDRYTAWCAGQEQGRPATCNNTIYNWPFPYVYGYVNQRAFQAGGGSERAWNTIMAYDWQCEDAGYPYVRVGYCRQLRRFSNPSMSVGGDPLGVPGSGPSQEIDGPSDVVRTFNETRTEIAGRRGPTTSGSPDLAVYSLGANSPVLTTGQSFTLSVTVRNEGGVAADAATLTYYHGRQDFFSIHIDWEQLATWEVGPLSPSEMVFKEQDVVAPSTAGFSQYRACISTVSGDGITDNDCSRTSELLVRRASGPDLVVQSPTVSEDTLAPGQSFTFSVTVRNQGGDPSSATTLSYSRRRGGGSTWTDDVGSDAVGRLGTSGSARAVMKSARLTAPIEAGDYEYRACVAAVSGESNTENNCSSAVRTTVVLPSNRPPEPVGTLEPVTIRVDEGAVTVDVRGGFRDPDGDALTYGARSSAPTVASVAVFGSGVRVTPVSEGSAVVTVTATDAGGSNTTATQRFTVTVGTSNRSPEPVGTLGPVTIRVDEGAVTVDVRGGFRDPDGDALTYGARSSAPTVASVAVFGSGVRVTPVSEGSAVVTVTATDAGGSNTTATQRFTVTVGTSNRSPEPVGTLGPVTIRVDEGAVTVDVRGGVP